MDISSTRTSELETDVTNKTSSKEAKLEPGNNKEIQQEVENFYKNVVGGFNVHPFSLYSQVNHDGRKIEKAEDIVNKVVNFVTSG